MVSAVLISFCQSLRVIRNSLQGSFLCPKQCKSVYFTVLVFAGFLFLYSDFCDHFTIGRHIGAHVNSELVSREL